jgi:hypothetical protein
MRAPVTAVTSEASPITVASGQLTSPVRVCRHDPKAATGMIASSEVASASSCPSPSTSVSAGTKMMPPPTPNSPAAAPAATPRAMMRKASPIT